MITILAYDTLLINKVLLWSQVAKNADNRAVILRTVNPLLEDAYQLKPDFKIFMLETSALSIRNRQQYVLNLK